MERDEKKRRMVKLRRRREYINKYRRSRMITYKENSIETFTSPNKRIDGLLIERKSFWRGRMGFWRERKKATDIGEQIIREDMI